MAYEVQISKQAAKDFLTFQPKVQQQVSNKIDLLSDPYQAPGVKRLQGQWAGYWRMRSGDYRIVFTVNDETRKVRVTWLGNRRDAPYD